MQGAPEQFGAEGRATGVADAICGPVAAIAFARAMGRQPTIAEALEIAKANGRWDPGTGMHGPGAEAALLTDMGVPNRLDTAPTREAVIADVASGNPVILSSPGHYHYFVVTGYDPKTGLFDTGNTGTALRGGSRYRTWEDIGPQAALFMQEPTAQGPSAATAPTTTSGAVIGATNRPTDIEAFVRQRAQAYGIDPETAVAVANSEGGLQDWARQSDFVYHGKREESYGPFQLLMQGGLGNAFRQETGLDPRDPANGPAATDWALKYASQHGWGDWHGAQRIGLSDFAGIGGNAGTTTPGGTPQGRTNDSPFAPAEQPTDATTYGANAPADGASDPWAAVNATLQDTRDRLAHLGQSATDTLNAASDTGAGLLNTVGDRLIDPNTYAQSAGDVGTLANQSAAGADAALREAYRTSPGQTVTGIANWVRTGDTSGLDDPLQRALQFLPGQAGAGAFGVESAAVDPFRRVGVGGALALGIPQAAARVALAPLGASGLVDMPTPSLPASPRDAQQRYAQLPPWLQTATSMVLDPGNLIGAAPAERAAVEGAGAAGRAAEAAAPELRARALLAGGQGVRDMAALGLGPDVGGEAASLGRAADESNAARPRRNVVRPPGQPPSPEPLPVAESAPASEPPTAPPPAGRWITRPETVPDDVEARLAFLQARMPDSNDVRLAAERLAEGHRDNARDLLDYAAKRFEQDQARRLSPALTSFGEYQQRFIREASADAHTDSPRFQRDVNKDGAALLASSDKPLEVREMLGDRVYRVPGKGVLSVSTGIPGTPPYVSMFYVDPAAREGGVAARLIRMAERDVGPLGIEASALSPQMQGIILRRSAVPRRLFRQVRGGGPLDFEFADDLYRRAQAEMSGTAPADLTAADGGAAPPSPSASPPPPAPPSGGGAPAPAAGTPPPGGPPPAMRGGGAGGPAERGMAEKVLNLQAEKRANVWDALVTHRAMTADLPKLDARVAVTAALEDPTRIAALNPKQQAWVTRLKGEFDADWQKAHAAGITDSYLQNYISHIVNKPPEDVARALSTGNRVSTFSQFTKQRTFPTIPELEAWIKQNNLPWTVQKDPAIIQAAHKISLLNAAANNSFLTSLRTMVAADGRPLVEFASKAPDDYATIPHPSLTKYRYAGQSTDGGTLLTSSPLAVHPEIAGDLRRFLEPPPSVIPRAYWTAQGLLKRAVMYNPLIHGLNVIGQASTTRATGPFGALADLLHGEGLLHSDLNAPVIHHYIADHGLNLAALRQFGNELGEQMRGPEDVKGVIGLGKQAIGGPLGKLAAWSDGLLWDHMVSNLQVAIHEHYLQQFMRAGDSEAVAGRRAATISNNLMGMIPPETQSQAARFWGNLLLFARNWTTSNVRMGRGLLGDVPVAGRKLAGVQYGLQPADTKALAGVYRGQALRGLFWLGATTLAANMAFSGRPNWMNDEGHFFDIDTGRLDALGNHEYVHNPLFKPLQDLIGLTVGTAHAIAPRSGIPDPTGRNGVEVAYNKAAPLLREAGSQALNTDLGQLLRTGQAQHIAGVAQDADLLGRVEQRARHLADTLAPGPIAPRLASTIADPSTRAKGLERLGLSLAGLTATQPNLMLSEQQGPEGDELRRLGINTKDPLSKGLSPDAYATYRAGVRQGERQAVAAAIADPRYARLSDDLKKRAILSALSKVRGSESAAAGLNAGHAPDEPPKYDQSKPWVQNLMKLAGSADAYALERAINDAVSTTARNRTPLQRRLAYYAQYSTPEWRKWSAGRRTQEGVVREVVGTAVPATP